MSPRTCLILATLFGLLAVLLGAFGAHGLGDSDGYLQRKYASTEPKNIAGSSLPASYKYYLDYQTAVRYHMWHALALLESASGNAGSRHAHSTWLPGA